MAWLEEDAHARIPAEPQAKSSPEELRTLAPLDERTRRRVIRSRHDAHIEGTPIPNPPNPNHRRGGGGRKRGRLRLDSKAHVIRRIGRRSTEVIEITSRVPEDEVHSDALGCNQMPSDAIRRRLHLGCN